MIYNIPFSVNFYEALSECIIETLILNQKDLINFNISAKFNKDISKQVIILPAKKAAIKFYNVFRDKYNSVSNLQYKFSPHIITYDEIPNKLNLFIKKEYLKNTANKLSNNAVTKYQILFLINCAIDSYYCNIHNKNLLDSNQTQSYNSYDLISKRIVTINNIYKAILEYYYWNVELTNLNNGNDNEILLFYIIQFIQKTLYPLSLKPQLLKSSINDITKFYSLFENDDSINLKNCWFIIPNLCASYISELLSVSNKNLGNLIFQGINRSLNDVEWNLINFEDSQYYAKYLLDIIKVNRNEIIDYKVKKEIKNFDHIIVIENETEEEEIRNLISYLLCYLNNLDINSSQSIIIVCADTDRCKKLTQSLVNSINFKNNNKNNNDINNNSDVINDSYYELTIHDYISYALTDKRIIKLFLILITNRNEMIFSNFIFNIIKHPSSFLYKYYKEEIWWFEHFYITQYYIENEKYIIYDQEENKLEKQYEHQETKRLKTFQETINIALENIILDLKAKDRQNNLESNEIIEVINTKNDVINNLYSKRKKFLEELMITSEQLYNFKQLLINNNQKNFIQLYKEHRKIFELITGITYDNNNIDKIIDKTINTISEKNNFEKNNNVNNKIENDLYYYMQLKAIMNDIAIYAKDLLLQTNDYYLLLKSLLYQKISYEDLEDTLEKEQSNSEEQLNSDNILNKINKNQSLSNLIQFKIKFAIKNNNKNSNNNKDNIANNIFDKCSNVFLKNNKKSIIICTPKEARLDNYDLLIAFGLEETNFPPNYIDHNYISNFTRATLNYISPLNYEIGYAAFDFINFINSSKITLLSYAKDNKKRYLTFINRWLDLMLLEYPDIKIYSNESFIKFLNVNFNLNSDISFSTTKALMHFDLNKINDNNVKIITNDVNNTLVKEIINDKVVNNDKNEKFDINKKLNKENLINDNKISTIISNYNPPIHTRPRILSANSIEKLIYNPYIYYIEYILNIRSISSDIIYYKRTKFQSAIYKILTLINSINIHKLNVFDNLAISEIVNKSIASYFDNIFNFYQFKRLENTENILFSSYFIQDNFCNISYLEYLIFKKQLINAIQVIKKINKPINSINSKHFIKSYGYLDIDLNLYNIEDNKEINDSKLNDSIFKFNNKNTNFIDKITLKTSFDCINLCKDHSLLVLEYKNNCMPNNKDIISYKKPKLALQNLIAKYGNISCLTNIENSITYNINRNIKIEYIHLLAKNDQKLEKEVNLDLNLIKNKIMDVLYNFYIYKIPYTATSYCYNIQHMHLIRINNYISAKFKI